MKNIIDSFNWRYATKQFDTSKKLTGEQVEMLTEVLRLTPSSVGVQPWKFVVVTNPEVRAKLREAGYGQPQITDASHLIVFSVRKELDNVYIESHLENTAKIQGVALEVLAGYKNMIMGNITGKTIEQVKDWSSRQVYIALGMLLAVCAVEGIDACPMEGFDPKKFDEILGLPEMGYETRVIATVGYRLDTDKMAHTPKVRFPKSEVVLEIQ